MRPCCSSRVCVCGGACVCACACACACACVGACACACACACAYVPVRYEQMEAAQQQQQHHHHHHHASTSTQHHLPPQHAHLGNGMGAGTAGGDTSTELWLRHRRWMQLAYPRLTMRWGRREDKLTRPRVAALRQRNRARSMGASVNEDGDEVYLPPGGWWYPGFLRFLPGVSLAVAVVFLHDGLAQLATVVATQAVLSVLGVVVACSCVGAKDPSKASKAVPPETMVIAASTGMLVHCALHALFLPQVGVSLRVREVRVWLVAVWLCGQVAMWL